MDSQYCESISIHILVYKTLTKRNEITWERRNYDKAIRMQNINRQYAFLYNILMKNSESYPQYKWRAREGAQGPHCVILPQGADDLVTLRHALRCLTVLWLRHGVRSLIPSCLLPRCCDQDDSKNCRQLPVSAETREQCLRRVELELIEVVDDQKTSANCSGRRSHQPRSVCEDAPSSSYRH